MAFTTEQDIVAAVVATQAGRLFCGQLMSECGTFARGARASPEQTYLCEGERNVGLKIFHYIRAAGGDPLDSLDEYEDWARERAAQREREAVMHGRI